MQDFTTVRAQVNNAIADLNRVDGIWGWKALVNSGEVKILWGFQHNSFFIAEDEESSIVAYTENHNYLDDKAVNYDGSLADCVVALIYSIYQIADERL